MSPSKPSLDVALETIQAAFSRFVAHTSDPGLTTDQDLFALLPDWLADADGRVELDDGSVLHLIPEHGDRSGTTGRLGAVQRFPDGRAERLHLIGG